ncbi:unnamed protein product [Mesocestoides corti]|uniref:Uncharacterized protein n=2 Tax=Mesocestoides corti TaxID=53468 RepID=A0A3P6GIB0_MESCO|nr:unnamed protein product [Mesocestoides corti]
MRLTEKHRTQSAYRESQGRNPIGCRDECYPRGYIEWRQWTRRHQNPRGREVMAATIPEMACTASFGPMSENNHPAQGQRSHSVVSIALLNENGENDTLEIDEADDVLEDSTDSQMDECSSPIADDVRVRRLSIADRVNKRRNTEFAFEFARLAAAGRAEEFFRLLDEHSRLVHSVQFWSTAVAMQDNAQNFAMKLQLDTHQQTQTEKQ